MTVIPIGHKMTALQSGQDRSKLERNSPNFKLQILGSSF